METAIGVGQRTTRFEALYARHAPEVAHLAYLLTGSVRDAEDLMQEAFMKLYERFGDLRNPESARAYLMRAVTNSAKNHYRRTTTRKRHDSPITEPVIDAPPLEEREALTRALRELPYRQQVAVVLRYCVDLSEQQTAEVMGTSGKAVKSLITRALRALREHEEALR
jgi:RNA polymerase sigma-70 factor (sigma-E family)